MACGYLAYVFALSKHRHAVAYFHNLVQLMGYYNNALPVRLHVAHNGEKLLRFLRGKHGGGFIQYQNVCPAVKHLNYFKRLLFGNGHIIYFFIRIYNKTVAIAYFLDRPAHAVQIEHGFFVKAKDNVFRRGKHIHQLKMLMYHAYMQIQRILWGGDAYLLPVNIYLPAVGEIYAGEHIHKGCFSAAVFAKEGKYLAPVYFQRNVVVGYHMRKRFCNVYHAYC